MAINFFDPRCISNTSESIFGIVDQPPATLKFDQADNWNVWVDNEHRIEIQLIAIDNCLNVPRIEGERCEALLIYSNAILFIELKDRDGGRWAGKSRDQLKNSIRLFKRDVGLANYTRHYAHIANKQRPNFIAGGNSFREQFEADTGFVLRINDVVEVR